MLLLLGLAPIAAFGGGAIAVREASRMPAPTAMASYAADSRLASLRQELLDAGTPPGAAEGRALLQACEGLDRGALASPDDASRVAAAAAALEAASPCRLQGETLVSSLQGRWVLVYDSALVRPDGSRRRDRTRRLLIDVSRPQVGEVAQTLRRRDQRRPVLDEELALTLPAPFPLPKQELRLVFSQAVKPSRVVGEYRLDVEEVAITSAEGGRRVSLPSPRKVLDGLLGQFGRLFPLELTLLTELAWGPAGRNRVGTCTALLLRGEPSLRVVRIAGSGEMRVFRCVDGGGGATRLTPAPAALPPGAERPPVGRVDAAGVGIEELWVEGESALGDDWLGYDGYGSSFEL